METERVVVIGCLREIEHPTVEIVPGDGRSRGVDEPEYDVLVARVDELGGSRALHEPPGVAKMPAFGP